MQSADFTFERDQDGNDTFPLSNMQEMMWKLSTVGLENGQHRNMMCGQAIQLSKFNMDIPRMERAIQKLYDTDDTLRTVLVEKDGKILQRIVSNYKYELVVKDTIGDTPSERLDYALKEADKLIDVPLTVLNQIMSRIDFYKLDEDNYLMVIYIAHILVDGVGVSMAINKIFKYYKDITIENKAMSFSEYRRYEYDILHSEKGLEYEEYYKNKLEGYVPPKHIPDGTERPNEDYSKEGMLLLNKAELDRVARSYKTSDFFLLYTTYHLTLAKYYGITDNIICIVLANRQDPKYTETVGLLCKSTVVRVKIHPEDTFRDIVAQIMKTADRDTTDQIFAVYGYDLQFSSTLQRENSMSMRMTKLDAKVDFHYLNFNRNLTGMDRLVMLVNEVGEQVMMVIYGDSSIYSRQCISQMREYFQQAMDSLIHNPDGNVLEYLK
jgi:hypothetical protein